jgi:hypothetical protein
LGFLLVDPATNMTNFPINLQIASRFKIVHVVVFHILGRSLWFQLLSLGNPDIDSCAFRCMQLVQRLRSCKKLPPKEEMRETPRGYRMSGG